MDIVVAGVPPYDGRYTFDPGREFTTREWGWIKRLSGYLPLDIEDGFEKADPELIAVLAVVMIRRAGRVEAKEVPAVFEQVIDAPFGSAITIQGDEVEDADEGDAGPPAGSSSSNGATSGAGSPTSSETPERTPPATGPPGWATSASASTTSAT